MVNHELVQLGSFQSPLLLSIMSLEWVLSGVDVSYKSTWDVIILFLLESVLVLCRLAMYGGDSMLWL